MRDAGTAARRQTGPGPLTTAQRRALDRGYLVEDEAAYEADKAAAARRGGPTPAQTSGHPSPLSPALDGAPLRNWQGIQDDTHSPTDSTGAIGTTRFVEMINSNFAIYDRTNDVPMFTGSLASLTGGPGNLFDPHILWDPGTARFYYVVDDVVSASDNRLEIGFSKTSSPSSAADFCNYGVGLGADFYDYPKLGDTADLWMIGANVFGTSGYLRSDVIGFPKPGPGSTCPGGDTLTGTIAQDLRNADGSDAFTPVPVNQTDTSSTGWIVNSGSPTNNFLSVFQVTKNSNNQMIIGPPKTVSVASFAPPANAVQKGSSVKLDTLDGRLTNAVSAVDPSQSSGVAIWTQHTVFGGPGAEVRWYEINPTPATPVLFQKGTVGSTSLFAFNGAISPDRRVNGASTQFGDSMVLGFNTSSTSQFQDVRAVSKRGSHSQSGQEVIVSATGPDDDFTCSSGTCRSGDYGGASPDPASDTSQANGVVWQTNQLAGGTHLAGWHTWNFAGRPSPSPK